MKWFLNLKIGTKLGVGFGLCVFLSIVMGMVSLSKMSAMDGNTKMIVSDALQGTAVIGKLADNMRKYRAYEFNHVLMDDAQRPVAEEGLRTTAAAVDKLLDAYEKDAFLPEDKTAATELKHRWNAYKSETDKQLATDRKADLKVSSALIVQRKPQFDAVSEQFEKMIDWNGTRGDQLSKEAASSFASAKNSVVFFLFITIVVGLAVATVTSKAITHATHEVSLRLKSLSEICIANLGEAIKSLAHGDITAKIKTGTTLIEMDQKDEMGVMAKNVNTIIVATQGAIKDFEEAQDALSDMIAKVRASSESIGQGSTDVSSGNTDLAQRTEEQASSLEETASSMEEMTSTIRQNADNAKLANQLAAQAREVAEHGGHVVSDAVRAMSEINEGSRRIADIISVIDEIAFQTNLLALNAAVEAARVGEQGRGFAVVASEVRNLAGRSATAAKEIKTLVQDSLGKVETGTELVNLSGERLQEIVTSVKKVADVIAEISAASLEQAAGVEQVNKAIMLMDQTTQQNAAMVEEVSAASQSMNGQARELQDLITKFKVDQKYLITVQQNYTVQAPQRLAATGTDGRPRSTRGNKKLTIVKNDDFEEF